MKCPNCGASIAPAQNFCGQCGSSLLAATTALYRSPESYTPRHLAEKILTSRDALPGERKQVTILFADIKGSLELLAHRDPEDARKLLDPVLELMMEGVHHYEGTVNQVMGDGIMAIFGAPLAHEDHAVRACYAALRIQDGIARYSEEFRRREGLPVSARIGINSGEVVVRSIASDLRMDYSAVGQATHLAARMEQAAAPGSILMTADALRLAEGFVEVRQIGPIPVKGMASAVAGYELTGASAARSRLQATAARGLTPFVGRDREFAELCDALERARLGRGEVVALVGEPGVGKSRLVHEFVHSRQAGGSLVLESSSASFGRGTPYLPVIELLKRYFKVEARDGARAVQEKVTGKVLTLDAALQDVVAPLLHLLDALPDSHYFRALDPMQHRQETFGAIIRLLLAEAGVQPVIVVFEDLHWNDSLTHGLLTELVGATVGARMLVVVSYRPEHKDEWKGLPNYRQLRLEPLASETLDSLLNALLGRHESLAGLKGLLLERTGGNPFFIEEIVRSMIDIGVLAGTRGDYRLAKPQSGVQVPPTVQAVLAARIDRLPARAKLLLQVSAVIGNDVPEVLLRAVSGLDGELRAALEHLESAGFLCTTKLFPDLEYSFKHSLTQEVAYAELVEERRREIHTRVVHALETLYADRLGEHIERLAGHAVRGQLGHKAVAYLRQAGAKSAERRAYPEAASLFEQALRTLERLPAAPDTAQQAIDIRFELRNVLQPMGDRERIARCLAEAEELAERLNDPGRIGWLQSYLTEHYWMLGRYEDAVAAGRQALDIAARLSNLPLKVVTNLPLGLAYHTRGEYRQAIECLGRNVIDLQGDRLTERFGMFVLPSTFSRSFIAWALAELGDFEEGMAIGEEALSIANSAEHPFSRGYAHLGIGVLLLRRGHLRSAIRAFRRALEEGAFAQSPVGYSYVAFHLGYALALAGDIDEGLRKLENTVAIAESMGFVARHSLRLVYLGEAYLAAGREGEAASTAARGLALATQHDERANRAYALRVLGEVEARRGNLAQAEEHFRAGLALAEMLAMRPLQANCHHALAGIHAARHPGGAEAGHRARAAGLADAMQMQFWSRALVPSVAGG